jgi:hypothetical protein
VTKRIQTLAAISSALAVSIALTSGPAAALVGPPGDKTENIQQLWVDPSEPRDLSKGAGGDAPRPVADAAYEVLETDTRGYSITYDVKDERGREWNVKIGPEAQTEVVTSRIVWALGYHQVPSYFIERWVAVEDGRGSLRGGARFRPEDDGLKSVGEWKWRKNPFVGSRPYNGLIVLMMLLNSTDLKDQNNQLYDVRHENGNGPRRWYVVKDLGASLGETGRMDPRRGYIDGFEREPFVTGVENGIVKFGFRGRHQDLLADIRVADVVWLCERVLKITDNQWRDAFHAGGYNDDLTTRFVARIKQKAAEGLALR